MSVSENKVLTSANPGSVVWMTSTATEHQWGADSKLYFLFCLPSWRKGKWYLINYNHNGSVSKFKVATLQCKRKKYLQNKN
jgi:hypothetical protein